MSKRFGRQQKRRLKARNAMLLDDNRILVKQLDEQQRLQETAELVCGQLPEKWVISVSMERDAAWVEAIRPDGYTIAVESADKTLQEQVADAVALANE